MVLKLQNPAVVGSTPAQIQALLKQLGLAAAACAEELDGRISKLEGAAAGKP